jgi:pimeloyl-ACP methyl ester carboxylesterase
MELNYNKRRPTINPPKDPWDESFVDFAHPPNQFLEPDGNFTYRLIPELRQAAQTKDPIQILARSAQAFFFALNLAETVLDKRAALARGNAFADLAVTGRDVYETFRLGIDSDQVKATAIADLQADLDPVPQFTDAQMDEATNLALDRAYDVAWALRGPPAQQGALRAKLGWIAVSGEDDKPHRPVNVPPPPYEQYETVVSTRGQNIVTRFFIASAEEPPDKVLRRSKRSTPEDPPPPTVPEDHEVILFLHGHSSGAEEALAIIPDLMRLGRERDKLYSVISIDLPNNGYSKSFDQFAFSPRTETTYPKDPADQKHIATPILDFIEDFIVDFMSSLPESISSRLVAVIGGSLGGNLALRLGRRDPSVSSYQGSPVDLGAPPGVSFQGSPAAVTWGPDRLDFFGISTNGRMYQQAWTGAAFGGWVDLGAPPGVSFQGPPAAVTWGPDRLDFFGISTYGQMYRRAWTGTAFGGWVDLGAPPGVSFQGSPAAVTWGPDRLDFFGIGTNRRMYQQAWTGAGPGGTSSGRSWSIPAIVAWSPASVWPPKVAHLIDYQAPNTCFDRCGEPETDASRDKFFFESYEETQLLGVIQPQPEYWYRENWTFKPSHVAQSRLGRFEIYNEYFRQWHWRVAGEQLIYSHVDNEIFRDGTTLVRITKNFVRTLLVAGAYDNYIGTHIYDNTIKMSEKMTAPGRRLLLNTTGHSIHFERPRYFANEIVKFLNAKAHFVVCVTTKDGMIQSYGVKNDANDANEPPVQWTLNSCIEAIEQGDDLYAVSGDGQQAYVTISHRSPIGPLGDPGGENRGYYLRTVSDGTPLNNIEWLPKCEPAGQDFYAAIWEQRQAPAWVARHGMSSAVYQQTFDQQVGQGFRLVQVSGYGLRGQDFYAAIWEQRQGPAWVARHGMSSAQYQQTFDDLVGQGYRLVQVSGYGIAGQDFYAAIWEQRQGPAWVARHGMSSPQYQQTFDDLVGQGYRLVQVSGYSTT